MAIGALGGLDYEMYKQPINYTSAVNPFSAGAMGAQGRSEQPKFSAMQERELDPQMLAQKAQNFQNGLGGTNNPDNHKIFFAA